jgi:hypothetical protein
MTLYDKLGSTRQLLRIVSGKHGEPPYNMQECATPGIASYTRITPHAEKSTYTVVALLCTILPSRTHNFVARS